MEKVTVETVMNEWKRDSVVDDSDIGAELVKTPSYHSKYLNYFVHFKGELIKLERMYYKLGNTKRRYYRGECTKEELENNGWTQFQGLKPSASELSAYLEYDVDMVNLQAKISDLKSCISVVEYILKNITFRDTSLKTMFEYQRYINGG